MKKLFSIGAACLLFVACGSSFTVQDVAGTYDLTSVDGSDLPAPFFDVTITSGTFTLGTDSTFRNVISYTSRGGPVLTESDSGTFSLVAPDIIFLVGGSPNDTVIIRLSEGGVLTFRVAIEPFPVVVYTKQ